MLFCQLAPAKSRREIVQGLLGCEGKLQHLGVRAAPKRSTLSYANAPRPWKRFEALFYQLLGQCHQAAPPRTKFRFKNKLLLLDATVIEWCVTMLDWARFRTTQGAITLHLLLDHDGYRPVFAHLHGRPPAPDETAAGLVFAARQRGGNGSRVCGLPAVSTLDGTRHLLCHPPETRGQ